MPSTVDSEREFEVESDRRRCWEFFTNLQNIGSCIPGCESVTPMVDGSVLLKVRLAVGYISRTFELKAKFKELVQDSLVTFVGEGKDAEVSGALTIRDGGRHGSTALRYKLQIRPVSTIGRTAMSMLGGDLVRKQADAFAACVKSRLEAQSTGPKD